MFSNFKFKRVLALLLTLCVVLSAKPFAAPSAEAAPIDSGLDFTLSKYAIADEDKLSTDGYAWYHNGLPGTTKIDGKAYNGKVLLLAGINVTGGNSSKNGNGITVPSGTTIVLKQGTTNIVKADSRHPNGESGVIYCHGDLIIDGTGFLTVTSTSTSSPIRGGNGLSTGVVGSITINNGYINTSGTYGNSGVGTRALTVNGGTLVATGAVGCTSASNGGGSGIWAGQKINLNGGMITARVSTTAYNAGNRPFASSVTVSTSGVVREKFNQLEGAYYVTTYKSANYTIPVYFDENYTGGGTTTRNVTYNTTTTSYPAMRSGFTLAGWYTDTACQLPFSFSTPITVPTRLYARWTSNTIAVTGITLNKTALALTTFDPNTAKATLTATIAPATATNKNVTWTTSNSSVATITSSTVNGVLTHTVTAVGKGTATITATASADSTKYVTCTVTVTDTAAVTGGAISRDKATINEGAKLTLTASVLPSNATEKGIEWSSSDPLVELDVGEMVNGVATCVVTARQVDPLVEEEEPVTVTITAK